MIGLSSFLALLLAGTLWVALQDDEYVAPAPGDPATGARPAAAAAVLSRLGDAVRSGDQAAAAALAVRPDGPAAAQLRALVSNARRIPVRDVAIRYLGELGGPDDRGEWRAAADLTWRLGASGASESSTEIEVRFAAREDDVLVSGLGGRHGRSPVWLTGEVEVRRGPGTLVVAAARAHYYDRLARRAVSVVRKVVADWRSLLVLEVPRSATALDRALGAEPGSFATIAGVTAVPDGATDADASAHVYLNPERIASLQQEGAQVVVSHEAAHIALDATTTSASLPVWLTEGFADYIALRDVQLPLRTTASQIIEQVRRDGVPEGLPDEDDFDEESEHFGAAYEASWLACRMLVEQAGEGRLLRFYRRAAGSKDFGVLFRRTFGTSLEAFTGEWRRSLSDLAA